jgi:hypothetical protein
MIEEGLTLLFIRVSGQRIYAGSILVSPITARERAMSLRFVTEKIDNVIFAVVVFICLLVWAVLGFPLVVEIALTAASVVVIYCVLLWMESRA